MIWQTSIAGRLSAGNGRAKSLSGVSAGASAMVPPRLSADVVIHRRTPHIARVQLVLEGGGAVHRAAIVPYHEVPGLIPPHCTSEAGLSRELRELLQELPTFRLRPAYYVRGVRGQIQRLGARTRVIVHQPVLRGRFGRAFLRG